MGGAGRVVGGAARPPTCPTTPAPPATPRLRYFEEVFTSEHWMVRVYRVLPEPNRQPRLRNPYRAKTGCARARAEGVRARAHAQAGSPWGTPL